ncbi:hypothetical protein ACOBQX_12205 [Actinokineospora sp. G85]|uniref:hypothetical protein n=1 Tax=Actinokineospora sp. G85 TaxID=3406626 RepID=UPI003C78B7F5
MGLFGRKKAREAIAAIAETLVLDRCWDDMALDAGVDAVRDGHLKAAQALLRECRDYHELRTQRVRALADAAVGQSMEIRSMIARGLGQPDAADALLLLGSTLLAEAGEISGNDRLAAGRLREARDPLLAAAKLAPVDATPWVELQRCARAMRLNGDRVWHEAIKRCPTSYPAHSTRLQSLTAASGGSHEAMFEFARDTADKAPVGSPLTAMVPLAHAEYLMQEGDRFLTDGSTWAYVRLHTRYFRGPLREELRRADEKWSGGTARVRAYDKEAHNLFGWAMLEAGDHARARAHLAFVGNRPSALPWSYGGEHAFARALIRLGLD